MPLSDLVSYLGEDIFALHAVCTKGTTRFRSPGNQPVRLASRGAWLMNSIGLQNPGLDAQVEDLKLFRKHAPHMRCWLNLYAPDISFAVDVIKALPEELRWDAIEVNASCPNVNTEQISIEALRALRACYNRDIYLKIPPDGFVDDKAFSQGVDCFEPHIDGWVVGNTLPYTVKDFTKEPFQRDTAGLSGPFLLEKNLETVRRLAGIGRRKLIGCGGIYHPSHIDAYLNAGCALVEIGSGSLWDPHLAVKLALKWGAK
jgi:dihydroorotate dehydrogenase